MGHYDCERKRFIDDNEERKMLAQEPYFSEFEKIHKCEVCENNVWCKKKEKYKSGCTDEFLLDDNNIYLEVYKKQN